jgi:hypothetical protein
LILPPSSHALVVRVRSLSAAILTPASPRPSSRSTSAPDRSRERAIGACRPTWQARPPSTLLEHASISLVRSSLRSRKRSLRSPRRHRLIACFRRLRGLHRSRRLWVPPTPSNPSSRGRLIQPRGCMPTGRIYLSGSSRVSDLPAIFQAGSSMGTLPSEASPRPTPQVPLGPCSPPCRFPPCGAAAPRISAFARMRFLRRRCSRRRRVAPLLVVSPLRGWPPGLVPHSCGTPLMGFYRARQPSMILRPSMPARTCALQSVRDPEVWSVSPDLPPWGPCLRNPPP